MLNPSGACHAERSGGNKMLDLIYMKDSRSKKSLYRNFENSIENENRAMSALSAYHTSIGLEGWGEKINKEEQDEGISLDETITHHDPDWYYYLKINGNTLKATYEIKCNRSEKCLWTDDEIFVKRASIYSMCNKPKLFPRGKLFVCTRKSFAFMPAEEVRQYPVEERWSKKQFIIPASHFYWVPWLVPVDFL